MVEIRYLVTFSDGGVGMRKRAVTRSATSSTTAASATASSGSSRLRRRPASGARGPNWTRPRPRLSPDVVGLNGLGGPVRPWRGLRSVPKPPGPSTETPSEEGFRPVPVRQAGSTETRFGSPAGHRRNRGESRATVRATGPLIEVRVEDVGGLLLVPVEEVPVAVGHERRRVADVIADPLEREAGIVRARSRTGRRSAASPATPQSRAPSSRARRA
jgi:hypothetical protein